MSSTARAREALRILQSDGGRGLAKRVARVAYLRLGAADLEFPLRPEHVADSQGMMLATPPVRPARGTPLTVGWIFVPPGPGSGGHTTMFRMIEALEAAGHTCVIYLYDIFDYGGDLAGHEQVIRRHWPNVRAEVRSVSDGLAPLDAYVATAWGTAHVLAKHAAVPTRRLYFVQDFEPLFYPQGTEYALAEDTYRFGFRVITVGPMLAALLADRFGLTATVAEFGCDLDVYRMTNPSRRQGVVFYAKPNVPRRGFTLGLLALREFHERHPEHEIHLFGDRDAKVPFPATNHGTLPPAALAQLYNECAAGIAISFTNLSLIPDEMLACGAVPVIGDNPYARASLDNPHAKWVTPTPRAFADALGEVVEGRSEPPDIIAASVLGKPWGAGQRATVAAIEDEVYGTRG